MASALTTPWPRTPQGRCGAGRCVAWPPSFSDWCEPPRWPYWARPERLALPREFMWVVTLPRNRSMVYWITPKAAHTTIANRLLKSAAFSIVAVADAGMSPGVRAELLRRALRSRPVEFTFVRKPMAHVVSATQELQACAAREYAARVDLLDVLRNVSDGAWMFERKCRELHVYPQVSGYGADDGGINRLHFVGRMEHMQRDWNRLMRLIGEKRRRAIPVVHRRPVRDAAQADRLRWHPITRAHIEYDVRCFHPLPKLGSKASMSA